MLRGISLLLVFFLFSWGLVCTELADRAVGTLITPDGIVPDGVVLVQGGVILAVGAHVSLPPGTKSGGDPRHPCAGTESTCTTI